MWNCGINLLVTWKKTWPVLSWYYCFVIVELVAALLARNVDEVIANAMAK